MKIFLKNIPNFNNKRFGNDLKNKIKFFFIPKISFFLIFSIHFNFSFYLVVDCFYKNTYINVGDKQHKCQLFLFIGNFEEIF